jgi:hypothetical protein
MKDSNEQWKAEREQIEQNVEELFSYAELRIWIERKLVGAVGAQQANFEQLLAILDVSAVVANGEANDSQGIEKLYYWLS